MNSINDKTAKTMNKIAAKIFNILSDKYLDRIFPTKTARLQQRIYPLICLFMKITIIYKII